MPLDLPSGFGRLYVALGVETLCILAAAEYSVHQRQVLSKPSPALNLINSRVSLRIKGALRVELYKG
jgi:hypothetical protein